MELRAGVTLRGGKYTLMDRLGQGRWGYTYRAIGQNNQPIVLKMLHESLQRHPDFGYLQRHFAAEAQKFIGFQHPHCVPILDIFVEAGLVFIVMPYLAGATLAALVQEQGALPEAEALLYIRQVGTALLALHHRGLLHRDVKPSNILRLRESTTVVLTDFGLLRGLHATLTQAQSTSSPGYSAPEQHGPQAICTSSTDLYSLAATLYYLLTAQMPILASLRPRMPLMDPRHFQPQLSVGVVKAIMSGMAMESRQRPSTIADWLGQLPNPSARLSANPSTGDSLQPATLPLQLPVAPTPPKGDAIPAQLPQPLPQPVKSSLAEHRLSPPQVPLTMPANTSVTENGRTIAAHCAGTAGNQPPISPHPPLEGTPRFSPVGSTSSTQNPGTSVIQPRRWPQPRWLLLTLLLTSVVAATAGVAFGLSLRNNLLSTPGTTLNPRQAFPDRPWPGSEPPPSTPKAREPK